MPQTFQRRNREEQLISVEEAQRRVLALISLNETEVVPLDRCGGRVLREDVVATRDVPSRDNSAMDGYAVIAADTDVASPGSPVRLRVIDDIRAGAVPSVTLWRGSAARIMTGAPIPPGADAVVQVELTDAGREAVLVSSRVVVGTNIRRRGEDLRDGEMIIASGSLLRAAEVGVLATMQRAAVTVAKKPRVIILATGDELVGVDGAITDGSIVNSNSHSLAELVRECGAEAVIAPVVPDQLEATRQAIEKALEFDFVITTGGVSAGAYDFVKDALDDLGGVTHVSKISMKPGKPVVVSTVRNRVVFGLPGNPVSCMVAFTLFVAPSIRAACGRSDILPPMVRTRLLLPLDHKGERRAYQRVHVSAASGSLVSQPMRAQGSGVSSSMLRANGYAITEPGMSLNAGDAVDTLLIGEVALAAL